MKGKDVHGMGSHHTLEIPGPWPSWERSALSARASLPAAGGPQRRTYIRQVMASGSYHTLMRVSIAGATCTMYLHCTVLFAHLRA